MTTNSTVVQTLEDMICWARVHRLEFKHIKMSRDLYIELRNELNCRYQYTPHMSVGIIDVSFNGYMVYLGKHFKKSTILLCNT